jgi:DNA repair protein RecO (recombination protein O)
MHPGDLPFHRQRTLRVEAIVLRHLDWGEADRLIWLFTREYGKLRAVAKGVRKARSRKAGHLEPFTRVSLLLARGKEIPLITQVDTLEGYLHMREDLMRMTCGLYLVELLDRFTYEEGANIPMFTLLADSLGRLNQELDQDLVARYYEIRLLDYLGFRPQLFKCAQCSQEIKAENQYFSALQGGALCPKCGPEVSGSRPISMQALKYLRHFQRSSFKDATRAVLTSPLNHELEMIMQHYLTYLLERGLNTPPFMRRARRLASGKVSDLSSDEGGQ